MLGAAAGLGLTEPHGQIVFLRLIFACAGGLTVWLTWRLGRGLFERREVAALGALLMAFHPLAIAFGATTLPRGVSTAAIVGAACLVLVGRGSGGPAQRLFLAGALVAAAFACRYSEAVFLPPLVVAAIAANPATRLRSAGALVAGFVAGAIVLVGLEDWWVYGSPFASLREFAQYTLVERQASARVAVQPVEWYLRRLPFWIPASLLPAFFFVDRSSSAVRRLALMVVLPVLLLSLVHHKDLRYLNGVLPFVALLGAAGLVGLASRGRRPRMVAAALVAITLALGVYRAGRTLIDNSNASVEAARLLAATPEVEAVGVTQLWAFGGRAYLRDKTELVELGVGPTPASLEPLLAGLDAVAIHRRSLAASPRLMPLLRARGFEMWQTVEGWADDRVAVLKRAPASAASATRAPIRSTLRRSSLARVEPAVGVDRLPGRLRHLEVALHDVIAAEAELSLLADRRQRARRRVDHLVRDRAAVVEHLRPGPEAARRPRDPVAGLRIEDDQRAELGQP